MFLTLIRRGCVLAVACFAGATTGWSSVVASNDPLHPGTNEPVRLSARATGDIKKISLHYERYTLSKDASGRQTQHLAEREITVQTCEAANGVSLLECEYEVTGGFPASSLVKYKAVAHFKDGSQSLDTYSFAAGAFPWPDRPIPIRVTGDIRSRLDIIFIPTKDLTLGQFKNGLSSVIYQLYFANPWYGNNRVMFNFWYSGEFGDYQQLCKFLDPGNIASLSAIGDAIAFLHKKNMRDCRSGKRFSSEIDYGRTLLHESGHALFGLMDEYCCDSRYEQQPEFPNLWSSLAACEADAPNVLYPKRLCTQLANKEGRTIDFWRIDPVTPAPGSIMGPAQHDDPSSTHLNANARRILWTFDKCLSGDCMGNGFSIRSSQRLDQLVEQLGARIKDATKSVGPILVADADLIMAIQVRIVGDTAKVERTEIVRAPLPKSAGKAELLVKAMSATDSTLHQYVIDDPRLAEVEGQGYIRLPDVKVWVFAPASTSLKSLDLMPVDDKRLFKGEALKALRVDLQPGISKLCEGTASIAACFQAERR